MKEAICITHCEPGLEPCTRVFPSRQDAIRHLRKFINERQIDISEFYMELGEMSERRLAELLLERIDRGDEAERERSNAELLDLRHRIAARHANDLSALIPIALGGYPRYRHWKLEVIECQYPYRTLELIKGTAPSP
jgi:hypothetical protein